MMAAALIPQQKDTVDPFWVTAARQLFSNGAGVFWKKGVTENKVLVDHLLKTDLTALAEAMEGTVAQSIVDPDNPKTALSVRAMLTANLSALEFLPDTGKPFSIREWIADEERGGFLFLTSRGDQHASLRGLISTWLEIAVNAMLSLAQSDGRRIWVNPDNLAGAAAARWLALPPEARERIGLMAPSHALREGINGIVRERLTRDGVVHGPAMETERLASRGYTNAEKALARNYMPGDVVGFHRTYKRLGVEKGDELRVAGVDHGAGTVTLAGKDGGTVAWEPGRIAARAGGVEVYKKEAMELRAGDRIRWTRNDAGLGLVNSQTAEVTAVRDGRVSFRLEDGRMVDMNGGDPQLRHIDRAWASTVHAFQGRTVDTVIAAIEANHPNLTNQKMLYVEISRARDRAELVTDDKAGLREQLEALTGERIAALEAVGEEKAKAPEAAKAGGMETEIAGERSSGRSAEPEKTPAPKSVDRDLGL